VLYPTVKNTLTGRIAFPALDALREGYDATGPGGALIVAALGALTLLGRAGAAISSPPAGFGDLAREGGREAPAPSQGAIGGAGEGAPRTR